MLLDATNDGFHYSTIEASCCSPFLAIHFIIRRFQYNASTSAILTSQRERIDLEGIICDAIAFLPYFEHVPVIF